VVRSLDFADQQRLVTAIMQIDGVRNRENRDLYVSILSRELGYSLNFPRHDDDRHDLWQLVEACLQIKGAIYTLVSVLDGFYKGSSTMDRVRTVVGELVPEPLLTPGERRELRALADKVMERGLKAGYATTLPTIYQHAVGPVGPSPTRDVRELQGILAELEELTNGPDGVPPLTVFVCELAEHTDGETAAALRGWIRGFTARLGVSQAQLDRHRQFPLEAAWPERGGTYLVIECRPAVTAPDRFQFTAWLQKGPGPGTTLHRGNRPRPLAELADLLEELLTSQPIVVNREDPDLNIEFVLPRELLNEPLDQLNVSIAGLHRRLGIDYPVMLRSLDRMRERALHHNWRRKWDRLREDPARAEIHWIGAPGEFDQDLLYRRLCDQSIVATAMPFPSRPSDPDEVLIGLHAGIPIMVFCRHLREVESFTSEVKRLLGPDLSLLPSRLLSLRKQADLGDGTGRPEDEPLGLHLSAIVDDADRIPEPYLRLEPPT
jgi:hypothetical protein